jgi:cephalosporin hydroxylase
MTVGVMGQKDWDEHLPKRELPKPVVYSNVNEYGQSINLGELLMTIPKVTWTKAKSDEALAPYRMAKLCAAGDLELATLFLHVGSVPGMCSGEKIIKLNEIMADCPHGDVVEIGTWWGKSALALLLISRRYGIGNVLCVDPWTDADLVQGVPEVDEASAALSADEAFEVFKMNLMPYLCEGDCGGDFNYFRGTSEDCCYQYKVHRSTHTVEAHWVEYKGRIALLHIDGNHAYEKVKQDLELWAPLVVPGGWVVSDDYDWRHGDGPKRAIDEWLASAKIDQHFLAGGAMFAKMGEKK